MARFMDVHTEMRGISEKELQEAHRKDLEIEKGTGVHFVHAWADPESGKVFCLSEGPDRESVLEVHRKAGHPTEEIYEVKVTV